MPGITRVKKKLPRAEKLENNRIALIHAAAEVVGKHGYNGASVGRITARAGLSQGSFYSYFDSRQDLFDILLPEVTTEVLNEISDAVHGAADFYDLEEKGFKAFLNIFGAKPYLLRVSSEAQMAAPAAFKRHMAQLINGYTRALAKAKEDGDLANVKQQEFETVACMLIGARDSLFIQYFGKPASKRPNLNGIVATYIRLIRASLSGKPR